MSKMFSSEHQYLNEWTFLGANTRISTHCYHDYPARMIPQVADQLIGLYGSTATTLYDPYCGTGTTLVEGFAKGINVIGTDLNPLARLIAKSKTMLVSIEKLDTHIKEFSLFLLGNEVEVPLIDSIRGIPNLEYWFKPHVIHTLTRIKQYIGTIENEAVKTFFLVAFSETVRESSNTRNGEFKIYRYAPEKLENFNPEPRMIMLKKLDRNRAGLLQFTKLVDNLPRVPTSHVYSVNSVYGIPEQLIPTGSVNIVVTSPPYGDSQTTVAYGQYSRFSAAWLGLPDPHRIDQTLMGASKNITTYELPCSELNSAISEIKSRDKNRGLEVFSFYTDLFSSIVNVSKTIARGGYACYVVGNRTVKSVTLPTDLAIQGFFEDAGFRHVTTHTRDIPNKRMPSRNSPTNEAGKTEVTMTKEYIVVMQNP